MTLTTATPEAFTLAVNALRELSPRREIEVEEVRAPSSLASYAFALGATVLRRGEEVTSGKLILLHEPTGHEAWDGTTRLVSYVTAEMEPDLAHDPLMPQVGWSWLVDALEQHNAKHTAIGGTVTQTVSSRFGGLSGPTTTDLELRASWTPLSPVADHLAAWYALLSSTAGLPPVGVAAMPLRRA